MLLEDLRTLVVLVESGDERRAAQGLRASPATVRRSMGRLEQRVGGRLVVRRPEPGPIELTPLGEQVLDKALDVLEAAADLLHAAHRPAHRPYAVVGALYRMLVDEISDAAAAVDPLVGGDVSLEFREVSDEDPSAGLARGRVDVGVLAGPTDLDALLVRRTVAQVPRVALLAAHHPLAQRSGLEVRQLADEVWVDDITIPDASWPTYWRCEDVSGRAPERRTPVTGQAQLVEAVRFGAGVAVRPAPLPVHLRAVGVAAVPLVDTPPCSVDLAYRQDSIHGPYVDALAERLAADLDARPVGVRIRASAVVTGVVVTGPAVRPALDDAARRSRAGRRGRLLGIGGRRDDPAALEVAAADGTRP
ncbi:MAG: LysR family transcriptional regulator [Kineosporiaceae bacterium]